MSPPEPLQPPGVTQLTTVLKNLGLSALHPLPGAIPKRQGGNYLSLNQLR